MRFVSNDNAILIGCGSIPCFFFFFGPQQFLYSQTLSFSLSLGNQITKESHVALGLLFFCELWLRVYVMKFSAAACRTNEASRKHNAVPDRLQGVLGKLRKKDREKERERGTESVPGFR